MTFQAKLALVGIIGLCIMFMVCVAGCGGVELMPDADGGAGVGGGTAGVGGSSGDAGSDVLASRGGAGGHGGVAGGGGAAGASAPCVPDACNTCEGDVKTPVADGTACGALPACSGMASSGRPGGYYQPTATSAACHAGACVTTTVDCSAMACPVTCNKWYSGCFADAGNVACHCVDQGGSFCLN